METQDKKDWQFKPGEGGRPKGAKNKVTREIQSKVEWLLELLDETAEEDLKKMRPPERIKLMVELQEYIRPKLQRVNLEVGAEDKAITKITFEVVSSAPLTDRGSNTEAGNGKTG